MKTSLFNHKNVFEIFLKWQQYITFMSWSFLLVPGPLNLSFVGGIACKHARLYRCSSKHCTHSMAADTACIQKLRVHGLWLVHCTLGFKTPDVIGQLRNSYDIIIAERLSATFCNFISKNCGKMYKFGDGNIWPLFFNIYVHWSFRNK